MNREKLVIIGSGPAGYSAGIYASRAGLNPLLFKGYNHGGQLLNTELIENFPGFFDGISGKKLMKNLEKQATKFGTKISNEIIVSVDFYQYPFFLETNRKEQIFADAVIIATGSSVRWLDIPNEERYKGKGICSCALCDGLFFKDQEVGVVGGGDSAAQEALYLSQICKKVTVFVRSELMRATPILQERMHNTTNIEIVYNTQVVEAYGDELLSGVKLKCNDEISDFSLSGLFIAIGHDPNSQLFSNDIAVENNGYISTIPGTTKASIEGIFAAGDVQDSKYRQAITAAASGAMAAIEAHEFLLNIG